MRQTSSNQTKETAKRLRREATLPERRLWSVLRSKQLSGWKFRRQHPIGEYIVDFYCADASLVVELDGASHEGRQAYDLKRQQILESNGLTVLRITNDEVLENLEGVAEAVLMRISSGTQNPSPNPSLRGRGAR